jgi:predicted DNA-binding protein
MNKQKPVSSYRLSEKTKERMKYLANGLECSEAQVIEFSIRQVFTELEEYATKNNKTLAEMAILPILAGVKEL